jgi:hypothetical protein
MTPSRTSGKRASRRREESRDRSPRAIRFEVFGPFELPIAATGGLDRSAPALARFWSHVEGREGGLSRAGGCFVLTERSQAGELRPWSVGTALAAPYRDTLTAPCVLELAEELLRLNRNSTLSLSLVCCLADSGKFADSRQIDRQELNVLEAYLWALCLARNPLASGRRAGSCLAGFVVPGLLNAGRLPVTIDARVLKSALGL